MAEPAADIRVTCLVNDVAAPGFRPEHGLSYFIESRCLRMLFDAGQSGEVLLSNAEAAGVDLGWLGLILLSHGHYDHTGGILKALEKAGTIKLMAHEAAFRKKYVQKDGRNKDISLPFTKDELWRYCDIIYQKGPYSICGGLWATGEIPRITPFEAPDARFTEEHDGLAYTDPFMDDQSIVVENTEGLMLICGCCHSGIVNTLRQVKALSGRYPSTVVGGLHLESADEKRIAATVRFMKEAGIKKAIIGHCSGRKIGDALVSAGVNVVPLLSGMRIH